MTRPFINLTWAIETGMENGHEERLIKSALDTGEDVWSPKYIPFGGGMAHTPKEGEGVVVFHGSLQGAAQVRDWPRWIVFENVPQLRCSYYYPGLKEMLLNDHHIFLPYGCVEQSIVAEAFGWNSTHNNADRCVFIRPDSNRKPFTGQVLTDVGWDEGMKLVGFYDVAPEEMCVLAVPQNIRAEYRFIVTADRVVTGSRYTKEFDSHGRHPATEDELKRAEEYRKFCIDQGYCPDPIWVLDLCEPKHTTEWRILEVGGFSSCGLYACDTDKIVEAVVDIVRGM